LIITLLPEVGTKPLNPVGAEIRTCEKRATDVADEHRSETKNKAETGIFQPCEILICVYL